jgi:serine/threonine protein kinase
MNIMLDPSNMYPESFHPVKINRSAKDSSQKAKRYSRTLRPTKYLLIDFGLSQWYNPADGPPLDKPYSVEDRSVYSEHQDWEACYNPFPSDVYSLGLLVREHMRVRAFSFFFFSSTHIMLTDNDLEIQRV